MSLKPNGHDNQSDQTSTREKIGNYDNLHYIANYLESKTDTLKIQYGYNLCLCPKWYITHTNESIWVESLPTIQATNYSNNENSDNKITVVGRFYKYQGVPTKLYDYNYLSGKSVPNARIFKIESILE